MRTPLIDAFLQIYNLSSICNFWFNKAIKRIRILAYILIPNESENTYNILFPSFKNKFGFIDFNNTSCKELKKIFLIIYIIVKCFFSVYISRIKLLGLTKKH